MSTDFSIKPVGAPVAAPIAPPVSEAVQTRSRPNCRRARASRRRTRARARSINSNVVNASVSNQVVIDRDAASIVYQVVDNRTSQVVKQFPDEAMLRRRAYFHALDLTKRSADPPARHRPQGLSDDQRQVVSSGCLA